MNEELSRTEKMIAERSVGVVLVQGNAINGEPIWAYVAVKLSDLEKFMRAQQEGNFDPEEYGVIIEGGVGKIPPADVMQRMEVEYGFNHDQMLDLKNPES